MMIRWLLAMAGAFPSAWLPVAESRTRMRTEQYEQLNAGPWMVAGNRWQLVSA
jgi:hypothetical protein